MSDEQKHAIRLQLLAGWLAGWLALFQFTGGVSFTLLHHVLMFSSHLLLLPHPESAFTDKYFFFLHFLTLYFLYLTNLNSTILYTVCDSDTIHTRPCDCVTGGSPDKTLTQDTTNASLILYY
uniref:Uncharacterized protein n=1 Tax=Glossina brevipalpis TaxID=37001 RepID=A0A1A9WSA9_9MUSC